MRTGKEHKFTQLLTLIESILTPLRHKEELQQFVSDERLTLAIIDRTPPIYCVSDFRHSIQAIKSKNVIEHVHPCSVAKTSFYCVIDNSWIALNAKNQDLAEPTDYPHPYEPYFHFRDNYDEYRKEKMNMKYKLECEVIQVRRWSLKIVNISKSGYYGVVMELLDYRSTGQKFSQNAANIYASIYEYSIKEKLQILRLNDLKQLNTNKVDKKVPYSLFYYCRNTNLKPAAKKVYSIINADVDQEMLTYNNRRQYALVNFGQMEGLNCLQYPLTAQEKDRQKGNQLRNQDWKIFFNAIQSKKQKEKKEERQVQPGELWSSDQQQEEEPSNQDPEERSRAEEPTVSEHPVSESSDSEEDPLRNLYVRQFQNMRIV